MNKNIIGRIQEHLDKVRETYENDWFVICLQGSQNYGIADEDSDIDTKCLVLPTFEQLVFNKPAISHTLVMENDEHCDVKDIREYFKIVRKSNINFVEIFFTDWYIVNPEYQDLWDLLVENNELIARINPYRAISAMRGMAHEKYHALKHEYPSRMHMIEKFGYDPKQLSHLLRIRYFINLYILGKPYKECIYLKNSLIRHQLYDVKRNGWTNKREGTYDEVALSVLETIDHMYNEKKEEFVNENDPIAEELLDSVLEEIMKRTLRRELN